VRTILLILIAFQAAKFLRELWTQQSLQFFKIELRSNQREIYVIYVSILHDTFDEVFVLFGHVHVDLFHQARKFLIKRLDLLLTYLQKTVLVEEEVLGRVARQPLLRHSPLDLLLAHLQFVLLGQVVLVFDDDTVLNESLILLVEYFGIDFYLVEGDRLVVLLSSWVFPALDFPETVRVLQELVLGKQSEAVVDERGVQGGHREARVLAIE
jgi:hypothetical protein